MLARPNPGVNCPHCGSRNAESATACEACSRDLILYIGPAQSVPRRFSIEGLMVLIAVVAVGLAVSRLSWFLGVLFLIISTAATIRGMAIVGQRIEDQLPCPIGDRVSIGVRSIGLMMVVAFCTLAVSAFVAMVVSSMVWNWDPEVTIGCAIGSIGIGLFVGGWILVRNWKSTG